MKVNVTTKEKQFEPIELNITIESKGELNTWLSIFNGMATPDFKEVIRLNKSVYADGELTALGGTEAYEQLKKHSTIK